MMGGLKSGLTADRWLAVFALVCFVGLDVASTVVAYNYVGTFKYEQSGLLLAAYSVGGIAGAMVVKAVVASGAIAAAYLLGTRFEKARSFARGVLLGTALGGIYVSASNFAIPLTGQSIQIAGINGNIMTIIIVVVCALAGLLGFLYRPRPTRGA